MMGKPKISVFIPYYNDEKFLRESIESVLDQKYENIELILLNHASTDSSRSIAHSYDDKRIVHIDMDMNYGAGGGLLLKEFIKRARGEYYKFFCADDIMYENCLSDLVSYMETHKDKDFIFGNVEYIDKQGQSLNDDWFSGRPHFSLKHDEIACLKLYASGVSFLPYVGSFVRRDAFSCVELDLSMIMLFDMHLWVQMLLAEKKIGYLNKYVAGYRIHSQQVSAVENEDVAGVRSYFERPSFLQPFAQCKSVKLIKKLFSTSTYVDRLEKADDIPFVVYHYFFKLYREPFVALQLHDMLQAKDSRERLLSVFEYDIRKFREEYSIVSPKKTSWKNRLYDTPSKQLGCIQLLYLLLRRTFNTIILKELQKKRKEKKHSV